MFIVECGVRKRIQRREKELMAGGTGEMTQGERGCGNGAKEEEEGQGLGSLSGPLCWEHSPSGIYLAPTSSCPGRLQHCLCREPFPDFPALYVHHPLQGPILFSPCKSRPWHVHLWFSLSISLGCKPGVSLLCPH